MVWFHDQESAGPGWGRRGDGGSVMGRQFLWAALAAVITTTIVQPASAQEPSTGFYQATGNLFLKICRGGIAGRGYCLGYFAGISDGITTLQLLKPQHWTPICKPDQMTDSQLRDVVVEYLDTHPEERHEPISLLTV